jgi:glutamate decarboxylase
MSAQRKVEIVSGLDDEVLGASFLPQPLPRYKIPQHETDPTGAYQLVHDELLLDGNPRQNLATFTQTWVEPEVRKLMDEGLNKNMAEKSEYPLMAELEARCVRMLADLWASPDAANTVGCSTSGSSEAAMLGGLAMKWRWRKRREQAGLPTDKPNLICGPAHICWSKFARYFDVELRQIPCEGQRLMMSPSEVIARCDENTIGVVPTLGLTYILKYEPVHEVAIALDDLEEEHGLDIPIHVDGATGAFVAPFIHPSLVWDFRIPRVKSINASGHKYGLTPLGCGWIIWREAEDLPEDLIFRVKYLGGNMPTIGLTFSKPGGPVASQYYNLTRMGREGYTKITQGSAEVGVWFADQVKKLEVFELVYDGRGGAPGCAWTMRKGEQPGFTLYDLAEKLRGKGWQVPAYPLPANRGDLVVQRALSRLGFTRDLAGLLLEDLERAVRHFEKHPAPKAILRKSAENAYYPY